MLLNTVSPGSSTFQKLRKLIIGCIEAVFLEVSKCSFGKNSLLGINNFCTLLQRFKLRNLTNYRQTFWLLPQMLLTFVSNLSIFGSSSTNIYQAFTRCQISRFCGASRTTFLKILKRWRIMVGWWRNHFEESSDFHGLGVPGPREYPGPREPYAGGGVTWQSIM